MFEKPYIYKNWYVFPVTNRWRLYTRQYLSVYEYKSLRIEIKTYDYDGRP